MAFAKFQDFLGGLVKGQRSAFFPVLAGKRPPMEELLDKLMTSSGEVSAIVTARELLDTYKTLDETGKRDFFLRLESEFNAEVEAVRQRFFEYDDDPSSANLSRLSAAAEPRRLELLRRLNQTPGAAFDLVCMREDLLRQRREYPQLSAVDDDFVRMFTSWFGRGFLELKTIDWSTPAAVLERIIRYEAVHEIRDLEDLRKRVKPANRRCFAFFHPALVDEPLIFVQVALSKDIPNTIATILEGNEAAEIASDDPTAIQKPEQYDTATFYSISNCQPGLKNISFGNFLIKQVVQVLRSEFPGIKQFVTLSPIPGFSKWLKATAESSNVEPIDTSDRQRKLRNSPALAELFESPNTTSAASAQQDLIQQAVATYLIEAKRGKYPLDPVARFHLGNGARLHAIRTAADLSGKGLQQSRGAMVNYLYDLRQIESNHESYIAGGIVAYNDKLNSSVSKILNSK